MRCYSCDRPNSTHHDGDTGRIYCTTCWNVIEDTISVSSDKGKGTPRLTSEEIHVTLEELMEEEQGIIDAFRETFEDTSDMP